jgi:hypothetical protein
MADLGDIIARAATNAALAQSEQLTGIPFFQQAQARQERESVRQDKAHANRARLDAGIRTGLINEKDVAAAGTIDDLVRLENFDEIFGGLMTTAETARRESGKAEDERLNAIIAATRAGVSGDYSAMSDQQLLVSAAAEEANRSEQARFRDSARVRSDSYANMVTSALDPNAPALTPEQLDAQLEQGQAAIQSFQGLDPDTREAYEQQVRMQMKNLRDGNTRKVELDTVGQDLKNGNFTEFAKLTNPATRQAVEKSADYARAVAPVEQNLETINNYRMVKGVLGSLPPEMQGIINQIDFSNTPDAASLIHDNPELARAVATLDFEPHRVSLERTKVEKTELAPMVEDQKKAFEGAAEVLPSGTILHTLFSNVDPDRLNEVRFQDGKLGVVGINPSDHPIYAGMSIAENDDVDTQMRLDILDPLTGPSIGPVAVPKDVREKAIKLKAEIEMRMSNQEMAERLEQNQDRSQLGFSEFVKSSNSVFGFNNFVTGRQSGQLAEMAHRAIVGMAPANTYAAEARRLTREAQLQQADPQKQQQTQALATIAQENANTALAREGYKKLYGDLAMAAYTETYALSDGSQGTYADVVLEQVRGALAAGPPGSAFKAGTEVPGESRFLSGMQSPDLSTEDQLSLVSEFMIAAFEGDGADVDDVIHDFDTVFKDTLNTISDSDGTGLNSNRWAISLTPEGLNPQLYGAPIRVSKKLTAKPDVAFAVAALSLIQ